MKLFRKCKHARGSLYHFFSVSRCGIKLYNYIFKTSYSLRTFQKFKESLDRFIRDGKQ